MRHILQIHFRATARERELLNAVAEQQGTTVSAVLRRLIRTGLSEDRNKANVTGMESVALEWSRSRPIQRR